MMRFAEAGLAEVIAGAEDERGPRLGERRQWLRWLVGDGPVDQRNLPGNVYVLHVQRLVAVSEFGAAARVMEAALGDGVEVDVRDQQLLFELSAAGEHAAFGVAHERVAVEHELVLAADRVQVGDGDQVVGGARGDHARPVEGLPAVVGRGVDVDAELGAAERHRIERQAGIPDVFADADAERDWVGPGRAVDGHSTARREVAFLIEHAVVGQAALVVGVDPAAIDEQGGGVVSIAIAPIHEADRPR